MSYNQHTKFRRFAAVFFILVMISSAIFAKSIKESDITNKNEKDSQVVTETYKSNMAPRSGIALGGIGTGSIELRKDGKFYNWSIFNNWPKETGAAFNIRAGENEDPMASLLFFVVRYQVEGKEPQMKLLQINNDLGEGTITRMVYHFPWMEAVENIEYSARFPFVNMKFSDPDMPFNVYMEAFSPFIPYDVKNSALPLVNFNFRIESKTYEKVDVTLIASQRNTVGYNFRDRYYITDIQKTPDYVICDMMAGNVPETASSYGQLSLMSMNANSSYYAGWATIHPYYEQVLRNKDLPNLDDTDGVESIKKTYERIPEWMPVTNGRNSVDEATGMKKANFSTSDSTVLPCYSSLAMSYTLNEKNTLFEHSFVMAWNFPNKYASVKWKEESDTNEGHYYSNFFTSANEVATYAFNNKTMLHERTKKFLDNFYDSSLEPAVLNQINSHLNTFITSGRLVKDGQFGILEGLSPHHSWGPIATIDVSLYGSVPIIALFPELQQAMMRAHKKVQSPDGRVNHGLFKNFHMGEDETWNVSDRIDLPGQYIIMVARDYFWTNDRKYLQEMYPSLLKAMKYVLTSLDKNGDQMPDMEGARSSYDNFPMYGLASYIQGQWLCAMRSLALLAEEMGDTITMNKAETIFESGSKLMDKHLWNGSYYRLYNDYDASMHHGNTDEGCLTDQIIGQWAAHQSGLGDLFNSEHIHKSLKTILDLSYKSGFGLRNSSWPNTSFFADVPHDMWVDQGNTYWSGVELAFASFLIYEGMTKEGLELVEVVDKRYRKAGLYFDHQEFGGHYYRPMSAWGVLNSMLGLSVNQGTYTFEPKYDMKKFRQFFAVPGAYAHYSSEKDKVEIQCNDGILKIEQLLLADCNIGGEQIEVLLNGEKLSVISVVTEEKTSVDFRNVLALRTGDLLVIQVIN